jgi:hypothetical protein
MLFKLRLRGRTRRSAALGMALVMLLEAAATAEQPTERLVAPALPGFVMGYSAANTVNTMQEEIPRGETVEAWTRMVTTQRFVGLASRTTPAQYAQNVIAPLQRACPDATISAMSSLTVSGRPSVRFQVDCPHSVGGRPESFILIAIAGRSDMHVKQAAWRGGTTAATLGWGRLLINSTVLCAAPDRQTACR